MPQAQTVNINWDDPSQRLWAVERLGPEEYNRAFRAHLKASIIATVNGRDIRPVNTSRFGRLFHIDQLGIAFRTLDEAKAHAATA